jgi:integrase
MPKTDHRIDLSDRKIQGLKPAPKGTRYQVMDAQVPGFGVRVTDRGVRTFIFRTRFPGSKNPNRREIGRYPVTSLANAREKARLWRSMVKQGIDPAVMEERARAETRSRHENNFAAVAEEWFKEKLPGERKGTEVERDVRNQFITAWGRRPIAEVTEADVLTVIKAKKRTAPSQARNLLGHAKRLFAWAIDQRCYGITASPCDHLKPSKIIGEKVTRARILSNDELFALWRAVRRTPYPHGPVYQLLILNALRLNEAADASKNEVDRQQGIWTIPTERMKGKNGKARPHVVPLTQDTLAVFDALPSFKKGPHLFTTTFGATSAWMSNKVKKRIDRRMELTLRAFARLRGEDTKSVVLPHWTNHDIRRTVRSQLSRLKVTEEAREAVLAHARPGIKGTYDLYDYLDEKREALELWSARLRELTQRSAKELLQTFTTA